MERHSQPSLSGIGGRAPSRIARVLLTVVALAGTLALASPALAQSPFPSSPASPQPSVQPNADLRIEARALLGWPCSARRMDRRRSPRHQQWTGRDRRVAHPRPELRPVALRRACGPAARCSPTLHVCMPKPRSSAAESTSTSSAATPRCDAAGRITSHDAYSPLVAVIAERPAGILPAVTEAMLNPNAAAAAVINSRSSTCHRASRPGRPSIGWSGRTSMPHC